MIRVEIQGLQELRVRINAMSERTKNLAPVLKSAGIVELRSATQRINKEGGDVAWPPNIAGTPLLHSVEGSGRLYSSLTMGSPGNVADIQNTTIRVGTNVVAPSGFSYPRGLQEGTGIYGPSGSRIFPKKAKALAFRVRGKKMFFKSIKGMPQRPYLYIDEQDSLVIGRIFGKYIIGGNVDVT